MTAASGAAVLQQTLLRRALAARDPGRLHLSFDVAVIERYRALPGAQLLRTRTVGRIAVPGKWSVDVGIAEGIAEGTADGEGQVHLPFTDLVDRVPEDEWPHWVAHLVEAPASRAFLQMRMSAAACIDDGDTVPWERGAD
ncbi:MAG: hypothetical protein GEU80_03280 [Dehalococcoidia bacterium]|nr:hypothetical protein [Dehalococcoidia bacterium]